MFGIIIQARSGSSRFPKKIFYKINNYSLLEILILRLKKIKNIPIYLAIPNNENNHNLKRFKKICAKYNVILFQGSKNNVLSRFYHCSKMYNIENIIRITSDCPLVDPSIINKMIEIYKSKNYDYFSNTLIPSFPDGLDVEIFKFNTIKKSFKDNYSLNAKEHVTYDIKKDYLFKKGNFLNNIDTSDTRLTVDYKNDIKNIKFLIDKHNININYDKIKKEIFNKNLFVSDKFRNLKKEDLNKGQALWNKAQKKILNGNMLLSKNPDYILPGYWPTYYEKANGINVKGIDKKNYKDLYMMSVGTNLLGYSNKSINNKVIRSIKNSNMSSLNCHEEVEVAELLLKMHSWASKVKFAKTGGEANTIAIRLARCSSNYDNIAFCGYHGWHDWYLSSNLNTKNNLDFHLLPNLETKGIPKFLKNSVFPFKYGENINFKNFFRKNKIGIVITELSRQKKINIKFLKKLLFEAKKSGVIVIFDECTSGFREYFGGIHLKYNLKPDLVTYGKAIGNGYPITAILGSAKVMNNATSTFISSTFWTERTGFVAALETLKIMKKYKTHNYIIKLGKYIKSQWKKIAKNNSILIEIDGLDALPRFTLKKFDMKIIKTYLSQEMLKQNILASNIIYLSTSHKKRHFKKYFKVLDKIFFDLSKNNFSIDSLPAKSTLKRLN